MSNVRLSNGSPTVERMEARLSDHPKPSACRNLYGPVDHEELKRDLKGHLREMEEASSERWNFDFSTHTPILNGRYEWEALDCNVVPKFYSRLDRRNKSTCTSGNDNTDLNGDHNCMATVPLRLKEESSTGPEHLKDCREQSSGLRKRSACHVDATSQTKRTHTDLDEVSCCPGLTSTVEHTPRKAATPRQ